MIILLPFIDHVAIDTESSAEYVLEGPSSETMRSLKTDEEGRNPIEEGITFKTPGQTWEIVEVLGVIEHSSISDTWWIWATAMDQIGRGTKGINMEIYVLWSPGCPRHSYLARHTQLVDTRVFWRRHHV